MYIAKKLTIFILLLVLCLLFAPVSIAITPQTAIEQIRKISPNAGVVMGRDNKLLLEINANKPFVPASCIKIPLVMAAHDLLGEDFRFTTSFYLDSKNNLLIKGEGDPFLVSEEINLIAKEIKQLGYKKFNNLYIDDFLFKDVTFPGLGNSNNPYDAVFSSLLVNFNTLHINKKNKLVVSAEKQTPYLPLMSHFTAQLECCDMPKRINLQGKDKHRRVYVRQLVTAIFSKHGVDFNNASINKVTKLNHKWRLIYKHSNSRSLRQVSKQLLLYSNNLIANALLLQLSPYHKDPLGTSLKLWKEYLKSTLELPYFASLRINEAAGLDPKNRLTPKQMYKILEHFDKYKDLLPDDKAGAAYKTGTLSNVYNAAGYLYDNAGRIDFFVVFLNNDINQRNKIINILKMIE